MPLKKEKKTTLLQYFNALSTVLRKNHNTDFLKPLYMYYMTEKETRYFGVIFLLILMVWLAFN